MLEIEKARRQKQHSQGCRLVGETHVNKSLQCSARQALIEIRIKWYSESQAISIVWEELSGAGSLKASGASRLLLLTAQTQKH